MPQTDRQVRTTTVKQKKSVRPALTEEANEQQMISLAMDLAKRQLLDGTASSQVITHYLMLGSSKKKLDAEVQELQKELLKAKTEALRSTQVIEALYTNAIRAMRIYSGQSDGGDTDEEY